FSSRRRHTRSKRDWSSDVCSSDLSGDVVTVLRDLRLVGEEAPRLREHAILLEVEDSLVVEDEGGQPPFRDALRDVVEDSFEPRRHRLRCQAGTCLSASLVGGLVSGVPRRCSISLPIWRERLTCSSVLRTCSSGTKSSV